MIKIGVFFGGQSREREISFAGGRTVFDNLNKELFEALPIFVDSIGNFILLKWQYVYKGTIRDFYPPSSFIKDKKHAFQVYIESLNELSDNELSELINTVGTQIYPHQFKHYFDFAFLALHGPYGEDGNIQGLLEWNNIPYSGSGVLSSAIGIDKKIQKDFMRNLSFESPISRVLEKKVWQESDKSYVFNQLQTEIGLPMVIKAPHQGSSLGITIISSDSISDFCNAINKSLFISELSSEDWGNKTADEKYIFIRDLSDVRVGIGMPVYVNTTFIAHPSDLLEYLNLSKESHFTIASADGEDTVLIESFIKGREFSCIVIQDLDGIPLALPPTEIVKQTTLFDYRSKYLPGMSRKITPIDLPDHQIETIRKECQRLYSDLGFGVYARIDGFINEQGVVFLNDPNTTSGMMPSSFFFHQAAEIGLNPSQFLTFIIYSSIKERMKSGKKVIDLQNLLNKLDNLLTSTKENSLKKEKIAIIMGGYSSERHISLESGRNVYEKLASSTQFEPFPVFLTGNSAEHRLFEIPINMMLKDNADDIKEKVFASQEKHPIIKKIMNEAKEITQKFASNALFESKEISYHQLAEKSDLAFVALHGRPGEDGTIQKELEKFNLPYNGSGPQSSSLTINKYETNEILAKNGILVANHKMVYKSDWITNKFSLIDDIENNFSYPLITKPADDGCSSAVKKIKNRTEFIAFAEMIFRPSEEFLVKEAEELHLKRNEEFPFKESFLVEELIQKGDAVHFLEITGGLLTKSFSEKSTSSILFEMFEPSEALATGEVLSLEEKFLAGEGQNITPARYSKDKTEQALISQSVKNTLEKTAKILGVEGYCRIDAFVKIYSDKTIETIIIEVNSLPGMTPATCIFHQCAINGYSPYEFIKGIMDYGKFKVKHSVQI